MLKVKLFHRLSISFLLFFLIFIPQACASNPEWPQGMPQHHTTEGFRNYPVIEDTSSLGFNFYFRRFISSFSSPDVPKSHILTKRNAIALYKEFLVKRKAGCILEFLWVPLTQVKRSVG